MENNEKNNKKAIITLVVGIGVLLVLIFSATFAYFSVTSRNNFGTKTITGTAEATGSVVLNGTSTSLRLNLTGTDMMKGEDDITYWATSDGTPSTTQNVVTIGSTQVTGAGYYNCDYTLSVTGTGTNNMYTAFQGMSGKSTEQIVLKIGDTKYDFNTANLFPITINSTLNGLSSSSSKTLTAEFYIVNKETVVQDALAGKDLNITITATNFSCTAVEAPPRTLYVVNGCVSKNSSILNEAVPHENASDAMLEWVDMIEENYTEPYYQKHLVNSNNIVQQSFIEFIISNSLAQNNSGMVAGTYELQVLDNGAAYSTNLETLKTAFGYSVNPSRCNIDSESIVCTVGSITFIATNHNYVRIEDSAKKDAACTFWDEFGCCDVSSTGGG